MEILAQTSFGNHLHSNLFLFLKNPLDKIHLVIIIKSQL